MIKERRGEKDTAHLRNSKFFVGKLYFQQEAGQSPCMRFLVFSDIDVVACQPLSTMIRLLLDI